MNETLERINQAETDEVEWMFRDCCGSTRWARLMSAYRPFESETEMTNAATAIWNDLAIDDQLEAFQAHPMIGETRGGETQQERAAEWSAGEQAGMSSADDRLKQDLADANRAYHEKFGFIFIVCATGKSAAEMLELCRIRLANDRETEIGIAAAEQEQITVIRLKKLLSQ